MAIRLGAVDRAEEALAYAREAVESYRPLAERNPAFQADLATARIALGDRLTVVGRPDEAIACYRQSIEVLRPLVLQRATRYYNPFTAAVLGMSRGGAGKEELAEILDGAPEGVGLTIARTEKEMQVS
jgi:tetratricopeptide (TPR) repeat protein